MSEYTWYEVEQRVPGSKMSPPQQSSEWWKLNLGSAEPLTRLEALWWADKWADRTGREVRVFQVTQTRTEVEL